MDKIIKTFFGYDGKIPNTAIITTLTKIYNAIDDIIEKEESSSNKGWWLSKIGCIGSYKLFITKIPPGINIIDCVLSLKPVESMFYLGYCGGIGKEIKIGDVVHSRRSFNKHKYEKGSNKIFDVDHTGYTDTINSFLLETKDYIKKARDKGILAVDMETYYFYKFCNNMKKSADSFMVVSDLPARKPFYLINKKDLKKIENGVSNLIEVIKNELSMDKI